MLKRVRQIFTIYGDEYRKHLIKSKTSYLINYFRLLYIQFLKDKNKIVAISLIEHIGDIIANEPISRELRKKHPDSAIIWFVRKPYRELLKYNPDVDKVLTVYCLTTWIKIREKNKFEAVYDLHFNGRSCNQCHVALKKENVDDSINNTNYFYYGGLLKAVSLHNRIEVSDTFPRMYIPLKVRYKSERFIPEEKFIVVHCSSNETVKDWDIEKWDYLIKKIFEDYKYHVVEIGSVSSLGIESDYYHNLCGKLSILQSASIISNAQAFIGIDSGPAHMANALGTPGVILLGEYYFGMKNYNPYSGNYGSLKLCRLVQSNSFVKNISTDIVMDNFESLLKETSPGV